MQAKTEKQSGHLLGEGQCWLVRRSSCSPRRRPSLGSGLDPGSPPPFALALGGVRAVEVEVMAGSVHSRVEGAAVRGPVEAGGGDHAPTVGGYAHGAHGG